MALTQEQIQATRDYVKELQELSNNNDDMFAEAQVQWLESCLESPEDYDELLDDVKDRALYWLEGLMGDADQDDLMPGGLYYWMTKAVVQSEDW